MDERLLHNSFILLEIICVIAVFAIFLIRSRYFTEVLEHRPRLVTQIILIVFYGILSIVGTTTGIGLFGSIGNVRDIGPMIGGLTCGPVIGIGAGIIGGIFRFMQGGPYIYTGLSAPIFCGIMGGIMYLANNREFVSPRIATLYMALCDTLVSIVTLILVTPPSQLWTITENIAIPMIAGSTIGVFIFSSFIHYQINEKKQEEKYKWIERENADKRNLDSIINTLADPVFLIDLNFCWTLVNDKFCQIMGTSREDLIGNPIVDYFRSEEYDIMRTVGDEVFQSNDSIETEIVITDTNEQKFTFIAKISPYTDSNGQEFIVGIIRDISQRKKIEDAIRESEARLTSILHGSPLMLFVIDKNHRVINWNKAIEKFLKTPARDIIGTSDHWKPIFKSKRPVLADILVDGDVEKIPYLYEDRVKPARYIEGAYEGIEFYPDMEPSGKWLYFAASPVKDSSGQIIGAVETIEDITERKQTESALNLALRKLTLLSSITRHDVLNKLTILSLSLYLSSEFISDPEGLEHIARGRKVIDVIRKQIEFTREYEELGIKAPSWQIIPEVVHSAMKMTGAEISFTVNVSTYEILADALLTNVFHNLFENSRQHGESVTHISISDRIENSTLIITIEDNGVGIAAEEKQFIFDRGFGKNTGFGLFISKEILAITEIRIREVGSPGNGAVFELVVPHGGYRLYDRNYKV